jgi:hypothetical protein
MRAIRISEEVWQAIADRGKFGETEDDVLRRVFEIPIGMGKDLGTMTTGSRVTSYPSSSGRRERFAEQRMTPYLEGNKIHVEFEDGNHFERPLPERNDKAGIRELTHDADSWAKSHGATIGQRQYIRKVLTSNGFYITK